MKSQRAINTVRKFFPSVKRVVDAKADVLVRVSKKDAHPAARKNHGECAMAVACKKKFYLEGAIISRSVAYLVKDGVAQRFKVPPSVSRELVSFDRGADFAPGNYALTRPGRHQKLGARRGGKVDGKKRNHHKGDIRKRFSHLTEGVRSTLN